MGYQLPSKAQETAQCRREDKQEECYEPLMDPEFVNVPVSHLKVEKSSIGEFGGRGLFAAQDISKNAILAVDGSIKSFHVLPCSVSVLENLKELVQESNLPFVESKASRFYNFMEGNYVNCLLLELILYFYHRVRVSKKQSGYGIGSTIMVRKMSVELSQHYH